MQKSHAILENINLIFRDMDLRKAVGLGGAAGTRSLLRYRIYTGKY